MLVWQELVINLGVSLEESWIGIDWGTTNVRIWLFSKTGQVLKETTLESGMNVIKNDQYEGIILDTLSNWKVCTNSVDIIACGAIGAKNGWVEVPYVETPCKPVDVKKLFEVPNSISDLKITITPGISTLKPNCDVLRGQETQIHGFVSKYPEFDGVLCLPGTHTKWVQVRNSLIVSFQTFMTGEIFDLLRHNSILRHSINSRFFDYTEFISTLNETLSRPERLAGQLFRIRAKELLEKPSDRQSYSSLLGILIGAELAGSKAYWLGQKVALISTEAFSKPYQIALQQTGLDPEIYEAEEITILGLQKVRKSQMLRN